MVTSAATKAPIEGIEVCAEGEAAFECAFTNASGDYDITGLPAGAYRVFFAPAFESNANYLSQFYNGKASFEEATPVVVASGGTVIGIDAALLEGGQITGKVTDAKSKAAIACIEVCAEPKGEGFVFRCARTNGAGEYDIVGLPTGEYDVEFLLSFESSLNYLRQFYNGKSSLSEANPVAVTAGSTTPSINAVLQEGGELTGKVTDATTKAAVAKIQVCAFDGPEGFGRCAPTNASGEYAIAGLATGEYKVQFLLPFESGLNYLTQYYNDKSTFAEAEAVSVKAGSTTANVDAALHPGGQIGGTVTAAATKATLGEVSACAFGSSGEFVNRCASTNSSGEYTISGLPTGQYTVVFSSSGPYAYQYYNGKVAFNEAQPVSVTAGSLTSGINAAMQLGAEITGTVTDATTKAAIGGVEVCASSAGAFVSTSCAFTDGTGTYAITKLPATEYRVEFFPGGSLNYLRQYYNGKSTFGEANLISVAPGSTTTGIDAALHAGGVITGTVTAAASKAKLAGIEVCAQETSGEFFGRCAGTDASGEYEVAGLPSGNYSVHFSSPSAEYAPQYYNEKTQSFEATPVAVAAGSTTPNINAALQLAGDIKGTVTDVATKAPIAQVEVCALQASTGEFVFCTGTNASEHRQLRNAVLQRQDSLHRSRRRKRGFGRGGQRHQRRTARSRQDHRQGHRRENIRSDPRRDRLCARSGRPLRRKMRHH
jgi:hypothetical protein